MVKRAIFLRKFIKRYLLLHFYCSRSSFNFSLPLTIVYKWAIVFLTKENAWLYLKVFFNHKIMKNNLTLLYLKETHMNTSLSKAHYWPLNLMKNIDFFNTSYRRKEYLFTDMPTFQYVKSGDFILLFCVWKVTWSII